MKSNTRHTKLIYRSSKEANPADRRMAQTTILDNWNSSRPKQRSDSDIGEVDVWVSAVRLKIEAPQAWGLGQFRV